MVDTLGALMFLTVISLNAGAFIGYYFTDSFYGITIGSALVTGILYIQRNVLWGLAEKVAGL